MVDSASYFCGKTHFFSYFNNIYAFQFKAWGFLLITTIIVNCRFPMMTWNLKIQQLYLLTIRFHLLTIHLAPLVQFRKKVKEQRLEKAFNILEASASKSKEETECEIFGKFIGKKLEKYSFTTRINVQQAIMNIMFSADRGHHEPRYEQQPHPNQSNRSSSYPNILEPLIPILCTIRFLHTQFRAISATYKYFTFIIIRVRFHI